MFNLSHSQMRAARQSRDARFDGLFYVGVRSTGIFCRPICPARMALEDNVTYHSNAADAMTAGYRPCKVCKPDTAPINTNQDIEDEMIKQAVALLQSDPSVSVNALAKRYDIAERTFRDRFTKAMGMAPKQFLKSVQLLFAKRLLQQSQLPVLHIALAAGFRTERAMQIAFQQQFSMSPSDFRQNKTENVQLDTTLFLAYRPPYQWAPLSQFLAKRAIEGIETVDESTYTRYFTMNSEKCYVTAKHNPEKNGFDVTLAVPHAKHIKPVLNQLARVLDCNANWLAIESALVEAGVKITDKTRGIRIPGVWDVFEAGCRAIFGQQVSVAAAINKTKQLVEIVRQDSQCHGFPSPEQVTPQVIEQMGMPKTRKQTLLNFAQYMTDLKNYEKVTNGNVDELLELKGIGPWTCQYIQMRGISHPDVWMPKDLAILRQCEKYALEPDRAKPWSSYLTLVLWHDYMENQ